MSNKHIQLKDKDLNYLYPVSPVIVVEWGQSNKISTIPSSIITNNAITGDMVVVHSIFGNPTAQEDDWVVTTTDNGTCQVTSGTIKQNQTTTLKLFLQHGLEIQGV